MSRSRPSFLPLLVAVCLAMPRAARPSAEGVPSGAESAAADSTALAPTSSAPWNPPRGMAAHEPWEQVIDAPLTVVSLPIRAAAALTRAGLLRIEQDNLIARVQVILVAAPTIGVGVRPASLGDRTGLGAALDLEPPWAHGRLRAGLDGSTLGYNRGRVELGPRRLFVGYLYDWRPQQPFFGLGADSRSGDASNYAVQSQSLQLNGRWATTGRVRHELGAWIGERQSVLRRGHDDQRPSFETTFPQLVAGQLDITQRHAVAGARAAVDTRAGHPHWSHGWRLAAQAENFGHATSDHGLVFTGADDSPSFRRFTLEAQAGWSFMRDPRTLRFGVRVVDIEPRDRDHPPALFDLSRLGGGAGLPGFEPGRFHGLDLVVARFGYCFPLAEFAELELSTEAGTVTDDVWRQPRLDHLEHSYSVMFRPRTKLAPLGAVGVSWSRETTRLVFSLGGVE